MYLLDTTVVSEARKVQTDKIDVNVARWLQRAAPDELFLSSVTLLELDIGVRLVEHRDSRQGQILRAWLDDKVRAAFAGRILPFDADTARICATLNVPDRRPRNDGMIAATALQHGFTIVTRNTHDYATTGVALLDPWLPGTDG